MYIAVLDLAASVKIFLACKAVGHVQLLVAALKLVAVRATLLCCMCRSPWKAFTASSDT